MVVSGAETQAVLDELSNEIIGSTKRERGPTPAGPAADASPFWTAQRERRAGGEQGVLPFEPAAGQVQPETTDESQRDETSERGPWRRRHPGRRRLPADNAGQTAHEADVGEIQRDDRAVGQHADQRRARPAGDPNAIRAMPVTRATAMATPASPSPSNNRPTSDGTISNATPVAASATAARISTLFIATDAS